MLSDCRLWLFLILVLLHTLTSYIFLFCCLAVIQCIIAVLMKNYVICVVFDCLKIIPCYCLSVAIVLMWWMEGRTERNEKKNFFIFYPPEKFSFFGFWLFCDYHRKVFFLLLRADVFVYIHHKSIHIQKC